MSRMIVQAESTLESVIDRLRSIYAEKQYFIISVTTKRSRSAEQNRLLWRWYKIISRETGADSVNYIANYCKYTYGWPILMASDSAYSDYYDDFLAHLDYEQKIKIMPIFKVTSAMSVTEKNIMLTAMQVDYAEAGIILDGREDL